MSDPEYNTKGLLETFIEVLSIHQKTASTLVELLDDGQVVDASVILREMEQACEDTIRELQKVKDLM